MYEVISQELVEPGQEQRFLGSQITCRYCGSADPAAFGNKTNAHTFPVALGNRVLFSLHECQACNQMFSKYDDAISKAIGPFLTLGGVKGRNGKVRQTGRSNAASNMKHSIISGKRHINLTPAESPGEPFNTDVEGGLIRLRTLIEGDKFVPLYAYKALLKMAVALLPEDEIRNFRNVIKRLVTPDEALQADPLQVGFSYAYVGNAPPVLAGTLLRRRDKDSPVPYLIFIFVTGSVCFQIWVRSDGMDNHVPKLGTLGIEWISQLPKSEGGRVPISYSKPLQFDWNELLPRLQPFKAFDLDFNPQTAMGTFTPIPREPNI